MTSGGGVDSCSIAIGDAVAACGEIIPFSSLMARPHRCIILQGKTQSTHSSLVMDEGSGAS
jgi:hypothetical protein